LVAIHCPRCKGLLAEGEGDAAKEGSMAVASLRRLMRRSMPPSAEKDAPAGP
jgi:hypothetical protein